MEDSGELEDPELVLGQPQLAAHGDRELRDLPGMAARVFVLGLQGVRQDLDGLEVRLLQVGEPGGVPHGQRGHVGYALSKAKVPIAEGSVRGRQQHGDAVRLPANRSDQYRPGIRPHAEPFRDGCHLIGLDEERSVRGAQVPLGQLRRELDVHEPPSLLRPVAGLGIAPESSRVFPDPGRHGDPTEEVGHGCHDLFHQALGLARLGEGLGHAQQGVGGLRGLALFLEQPRVLEGHGGVE